MSNKMSSRVKSMKFMQKASNKAPEIEDENQGLKDQSEWVTTTSTKILENKASQIQTIGYASINSFSALDDDFDDDFSPPPVRRVYENDKSNQSSTSITTAIDKEVSKLATGIKASRLTTTMYLHVY